MSLLFVCLVGQSGIFVKRGDDPGWQLATLKPSLMIDRRVGALSSKDPCKEEERTGV